MQSRQPTMKNRAMRSGARSSDAGFSFFHSATRTPPPYSLGKATRSAYRCVMATAAKSVILVVLVCLAACASSTQFLAPAPPEVRGSIQRVGIVGSPPGTIIQELSPTDGAYARYLRGVRCCSDEFMPTNAWTEGLGSAYSRL